MAAAPRAGSLYAVGGSTQVVQLAAGNGAVQDRFEAGRHPLSAVAVTADASRAFLASTVVGAWDLSELHRLFKFTGHPVSSISVLTIFAVRTGSAEGAKSCLSTDWSGC